MRKKTKNNLLTYGLILLAVIATICAGYEVWRNYQIRTEEGQGTEQQEPAKEYEVTEDPIIEDPETNTEPDSGKTEQTPTQYEGESANKSEKITGQITYAAKSGSKLAIRVSIDQYLKTSGTCELALIQNKKTVKAVSVPTLDDPTSATCQGFDLDATKLKGNYNISIKITAGGKTGTITGKVSL